MNLIKKSLYFIVILILSQCAAFILPLHAEDAAPAPNVAVGLGVSGGMYSAWQRIGSRTDWDIGYGYGAGFIVEKMFTNRLGIHSGLWFTESRYDIINKNETGDTRAETISRSLTLPLYLIVSANKGVFSFNFLIGFDITQILDVQLVSKTSTTQNDTADVLRYLTPYQFGLAVGLNFKFRVARYVDLFFGIIGDAYFTNLMDDKKNNDDYAHLYDARGIMGVLFRTNIFPIPDK